MTKSKLKKLWVEKYRPTTLADVIFQDEIQKKFFEKIIAEKDLPNLLLSGVQGTGKTTMSGVLVNEFGIDPADLMRIKCSDETGVDSMRDKISRFAETMPIGDFKVVQLEEFDFLSQNAYAVLRHIIEDSSDNCRFICTCNYSNKVMPAIKSRLQEVNFKAPGKDLVMEKMAEILMTEDIEVDETSLEALEKIVTAVYPDIRKTIQILQQSCRSGKLIWRESVSAADSSEYKIKLLDYIEQSNFAQARKLVCDVVQREEYEDLYKWLYQNIHRCPKFKQQETEEKAIVIIADRLYKHASYTHVDINLAACFIELGAL
jgi:replication factor C small subunit